jgi:hypothetical protein
MVRCDQSLAPVSGQQAVAPAQGGLAHCTGTVRKTSQSSPLFPPGIITLAFRRDHSTEGSETSIIWDAGLPFWSVMDTHSRALGHQPALKPRKSSPHIAFTTEESS